ncbi:MAG: 2-amino-4-hydroxy-6-hydroxymethyldihydropteridine diphosphokinase [Chitinispirillia bacterium]|nr:2-amino-4-hydroxy-6-hydroxymethyldihydropteridine diphosphokinase [Chitinispirillia bacterium]
MNLTALSIGSNLGDRERYIKAMERELKLILSDVRMSRLMETEPVGVYYDQPNYLNRIIAGYYSASPQELLSSCLEIEKGLGRRRDKVKDNRTADVDILLFGDLEINTPELTIPHPQIINRRFCLEGLSQIDKGWIVQGVSKSIEKLCEEMNAEVRAQNVLFIEVK